MKLIIFGPPGAGKGTQAKKISETYNIEHVSTGDIFRTAIKNETELGKKVKSILDDGDLVPDKLVVNLIKEELQKPTYEKGYILDGFPRTVPQAEAFDHFLEDQNAHIDAFLELQVPEEELVRRILSRGEGRSDDTEEKVKKRLKVYREETEPVKEYYEQQNLVYPIDGIGSIDEIFERIQRTLEEATEEA